MCLSAEKLLEVLRALQTSCFKKNFIFQPEKGTRDERAEPKLKLARAIMCSLAVSAGDNADHLLLTWETLLTYFTSNAAIHIPMFAL